MANSPTPSPASTTPTTPTTPTTATTTAGRRGANNRQWGRVRCQSVKCSLGEVLDLSAKGMRISTRHSIPTGSLMMVTIETFDGPMMLACYAPWRRRQGLFKHEVGICFVDLKSKAMDALNKLARAAAHNEVIRPQIAEFRKSA